MFLLIRTLMRLFNITVQRTTGLFMWLTLTPTQLSSALKICLKFKSMRCRMKIITKEMTPSESGRKNRCSRIQTLESRKRLSLIIKRRRLFYYSKSCLWVKLPLLDQGTGLVLKWMTQLVIVMASAFLNALRATGHS